jgi:hypothetical protein
MNRMITLVTTLVFLAIVAAPAQAQEETVRIGVQGGVTVSKLSGDDVVSADTRTGFFAGGYFNYMFAKNWTVAIEGNWLSGIGGKQIMDTDPESPLFDIKMSYFAFPVTLNFVFPFTESEKAWFGLQSGIMPMISLTCEVTEIGEVSFSGDCDNEESFVWAIPFGASLGYKFSDAAVGWIGARYDLGLSDAFESVAAKHQTWEFVVGVGFPTG